MDMSLDDYAKKKNLNVPGLGGRRGGRGGRGGAQRPFASSGVSSRLGVKSGGVNTVKGSAKSRLGSASVALKHGHQTKFGVNKLAMDDEVVPVNEPGNFKIVVNDARQKISGKGVHDARMKLSRKSGVVDARSKLKRKPGTGKDEVVTVGGQSREKTVTIGKPKNVGEDEHVWRKTISNSNPELDRNFEITRVIKQNPPPQIIRQEKTDLTIVRNFRPSLATFSVDDDGLQRGSQFNLQVTRKVPEASPVLALPDYSDLLRDTQRKLDAGHGDLYYGRMQADQETTGTHARVHRVTSQKTNAVEAPIITFDNDRASKSDPTGIIALPPRRKSQPTSRPVSHRLDEAMDTDVSSPVELVSPLQGFRVVISNLHPAVTQEDIIELFACIGPLKKARLVKKGSAEVVYVRRDDALAAVKRYHNRLLDNLPMSVKCVASAAQLKADTSNSSSLTSKSKTPAEPIDLDLDIVHRALFKNSKDQGSAQPVQFLVKI